MVSLLLASETVPFFDTFFLVFCQELVDLNGVYVHRVWVTFQVVVLVVILRKSALSLLGLRICEFESTLVFAFLEHARTLH